MRFISLVEQSISVSTAVLQGRHLLTDHIFTVGVINHAEIKAAEQRKVWEEFSEKQAKKDVPKLPPLPRLEGIRPYPSGAAALPAPPVVNASKPAARARRATPVFTDSEDEGDG